MSTMISHDYGPVYLELEMIWSITQQSKQAHKCMRYLKFGNIPRKNNLTFTRCEIFFYFIFRLSKQKDIS